MSLTTKGLVVVAVVGSIGGLYVYKYGVPPALHLGASGPSAEQQWEEAQRHQLASRSRIAAAEAEAVAAQAAPQQQAGSSFDQKVAAIKAQEQMDAQPMARAQNVRLSKSQNVSLSQIANSAPSVGTAVPELLLPTVDATNPFYGNDAPSAAVQELATRVAASQMSKSTLQAGLQNMGSLQREADVRSMSIALERRNASLNELNLVARDPQSMLFNKDVRGMGAAAIRAAQ